MTKLQQRIQKTSKIVYWLLRWLCLYPAAKVAQQLLRVIQLTRGWGGQPEALPAGLTFAQAVMLRLCAALVYFCLAAAVVQVQKIFWDIIYEYTPFQAVHVTRLRRGAIYGLLYSVGYFLTARWAFHLGAVSETPGVNAGHFLLPVLFYCFSLILDYGYQLQRQADETL